VDQAFLNTVIADGESATVDFKIECHAFAGSDADKAELAKDICALANNGQRHSYLIIGVSDDGAHRKSVTNVKLTDDNLQTFVRDAVYPPPKLTLVDLSVRAQGRLVAHKVIVVGKNARTAYRLARDFLYYREQKCFRKNEVWIRRGATSDLATPEEIARLVSGEEFSEPAGTRGVLYSILTADERQRAILADIQCATEEFHVYGQELLAIFAVNDKPFAVRIAYVDTFLADVDLQTYSWRRWAFEHGVLFVTPGRVPPHYFGRPRPSSRDRFSVVSRERWGYYALLPLPGSGTIAGEMPSHNDDARMRALKNGPPLTLPVFVIAGVSDSRELRMRVRALVEFANDPAVARQLDSTRTALRSALRGVIKRRSAIVPSYEAVTYHGRVTRVRPDASGRLRELRVRPTERLAEFPEYLRSARFTLALEGPRLGPDSLPPGRVFGEHLTAMTRADDDTGAVHARR
jgi:schlafen family protein